VTWDSVFPFSLDGPLHSIASCDSQGHAEDPFFGFLTWILTGREQCIKRDHTPKNNIDKVERKATMNYVKRACPLCASSCCMIKHTVIIF
jgi:hypothetical protein